MHTHTVTEPAHDGKRPRIVPIDHATVVTDGGVAYVAAAGRLVHTCGVPDGELQHSVHLESPVRAICAAATSQPSPSWSYALATADGVRLMSRAGEAVRELTSKRIVRSLGSTDGKWLAAATMDGSVELWDVATPRQASGPYYTLNAYNGSDGMTLEWRPDGGALAIGGKRGAVFDFTGSNAPHPYRANTARSNAPIGVGQPDPIPRVCMADGAKCVAWAACPEDSAASRLATVGEDGVVRVLQPHLPPLRKGGNGNPAQPHLMKPLFYTFVKEDAAHPSGEVATPCAVMWLREDSVAVAYLTGEIVAWRVS